MTATATLMERTLDMTFVSDTPTAARLKRLVAALDLPADNLAVRWAICRSLAEGPMDCTQGHEGGGKELKGRTLFGSNELAPLLLAQILLVEGSDALRATPREVVVAHWTRGQELLDADLDRLGGNGESLVLQEIDRRTLTTRVADFAGRIIGQPSVVEAFERLHSEAWSTQPAQLDAPVVILGRPGMGRSYLADLLARSLADAVINIQATGALAGRDLRDRLPRGPHHRPVLLVEDLDRLSSSARSALRSIATETSVIATATRAPTATGVDRVVEIQAYDRDAIAQIIRRKYGWHLEVRRLVSLAGRLRPAHALARADDLARRAPGPTLTEGDAAVVVRDWGLDRLGLDETDHLVMGQILDLDGPTLKALADDCGIDVDVLELSVLPYLGQLGLAVASPEGRWSLTTIGAETYGT